MAGKNVSKQIKNISEKVRNIKGGNKKNLSEKECFLGQLFLLFRFIFTTFSEIVFICFLYFFVSL